MKKLKLASILVVISILLISLPVKATEGATRENTGLSTNDVTKMTQEEYTYVFTELARDVLEKQAVATDIYYNSFTQECVFNYADYVIENTLKGKSITERSVEYVTPDNSGTGDTVIMVNLKTTFIKQYNMCYLFEYHIDTNGKISSFKVWQY